MRNGIIVSIQGYSKTTTNELTRRAIAGGAVGIRTDQPIKCKAPVIGLEKLHGMPYYITTTKESILRVSKWTDLVAIDSRRGNAELSLLYSICHVNNIKIVADIEKIQDVENILNICKGQGIITPEYIATTFSGKNINLVNEIKQITNIPIIAEGGYSCYNDIDNARKAGANNICIGTAISDIKELTKLYDGYFKNIII